jgi:hypothetical protein
VKARHCRSRTAALLLLYYCFTAALLLQVLACDRRSTLPLTSYGALLQVITFTAALLLLYCCFTAAGASVRQALDSSAHELRRVAPGHHLYCCFTAALLLIYCGFTAHELRRVAPGHLLYCCFTAALLLLTSYGALLQVITLLVMCY